jgi:hypothetical protein
MVTQSTDVMNAFSLCERSRWKKASVEPFASIGSRMDTESLETVELEKEEAAAAPGAEIAIREASKGLSPTVLAKSRKNQRSLLALSSSRGR